MDIAETLMRILLINPVARRTRGYHNSSQAFPPLGLQVLAQLTPPGHEVDLVDEALGPIDTDNLLQKSRYDLVGITAMTSGATRAYELAGQCRVRGIPCIMGGPHAWAMPDEAARFFDAITLGECDALWPTILADAAAGKMQKRYQGEWVDLQRGYGRAQQSLRPLNGRYSVNCLQTSRGCPVGCAYCSVTRFNGPKIRRRDVDDIVAEWNSTEKGWLFVVDDNFFGVGPEQGAWAKGCLEAIIQRGKRRQWFSQTTINMGTDPEALRLAYRAGCRAMLVGLESFDPENLRLCHKGINRSYAGRYKEMVDNFHRAGIAVFGAFIVGAERDTEDTAAQTALAAVETGVDIIQITNLTPLPGTPVYDDFLRAGRITACNYPQDWERYTFVETVFKPQRMEARTLDATLLEVMYHAGRRHWPWRRSLKTLWRTRSLRTAIFVHVANCGMRRIARSLAPDDAIPPIPPERARKIKRAMT